MLGKKFSSEKACETVSFFFHSFDYVNKYDKKLSSRGVSYAVEVDITEYSKKVVLLLFDAFLHFKKSEPQVVTYPIIKHTGWYSWYRHPRLPVPELSFEFEQAVAQQASRAVRDFIKEEEFEVSSDSVAYAEGIAAALAAIVHLHPEVASDMSKLVYTVATAKSLSLAPFICKGVNFSINIGAIVEDVKKPLSCVSLAPTDRLVTLEPGQVWWPCWVVYSNGGRVIIVSSIFISPVHEITEFVVKTCDFILNRLLPTLTISSRILYGRWNCPCQMGI